MNDWNVSTLRAFHKPQPKEASMPSETKSPSANALHKPALQNDKPKDAPVTANSVLAKFNADPDDLASTGGIQRAVDRNSRALRALADFIDGKHK